MRTLGCTTRRGLLLTSWPFAPAVQESSIELAELKFPPSEEEAFILVNESPGMFSLILHIALINIVPSFSNDSVNFVGLGVKDFGGRVPDHRERLRSWRI